jgi:hypothetical protein
MAKVTNVTKDKQNDLDKDPDNFNSEEIEVKNLFYSDSTSILEISQEHSDGFSSDILKQAKKDYDIDKVRDLKKPEKKEKFLKEIERQSKCLEKARQEISIHSAKFECILLYQQGVLLKEAEEFFKPKKKSFIKWRKKTFPNQHLRTLQQAQKLAKIGPEVLDYSAMGKARILALKSLRKNVKDIDFEELVKKYPFPDLSKDENGNEFSEHGDAIITLYRLRANRQEAGIKEISFVTFEQAQLIAAIRKEAIKVRDADRLKKEIAKEKDQEAFFERYLLNKAVLSNEATKKTAPSLDSLLAGFLNNCTDKKLGDKQWVESHKDKFNKDNIVAAYNRIKSIADKFNIDLEKTQQSTVSEETI